MSERDVHLPRLDRDARRGRRHRCFGISTDTFFTLKAWADQQRFGFPLLSDYNKDVIRSYGVVNPDMIGLKDIAKRAVFVIGRDGAVRHREVLDDARNEPDYERSGRRWQAVAAARQFLESRSSSIRW